MKKHIITAIIIFFTPVWLALLFIFGQNSAAFLLNSNDQNILSVKNINLPKLYLVQSGSMEPAVGVGSVVVVSPDTTYVNGDVVSFDIQGTGKNIITHRVAYKEFPNGVGGDPEYVTKGDANEDFDTTKVTDKNIIGKVRLTVPYLGYLASTAKKPWGFILLVIVPATILIYEELKTIFGEAKRGVKKVIQHRVGDNVSAPRSNSKNIFYRLFRSSAYFLPIFGAGLVFISLSASFFSDSEATRDNLFQAASSFGTPTPEVTVTPTPQIALTLVINEVLPDSTCSQGQTEAQWIEIYNGYPNMVNLKNYKITDGTNVIDLVNANNIDVPSGGLVLLAHSASIWGENKCYLNNGTLTANLGGQLSFDVGHLQLLDPSQGDIVMDDVQWGGSTGLLPLQNQSIERNPKGWDTAAGINFNTADFVIRATPAPGN